MSVESEIHETFFESWPWPGVLETSVRQAVASCPAVYAITTNHPFGRVRGTSNILYIGHTGLLGGRSDRARLYAYSYSRAQRDIRVRDICAALVADGNHLTFRWMPINDLKDAKMLEARLLAQCYAEHCELPPMNRSAPTQN